jgi:rhodanese-related sulfurtransferase
MHYITAIDLKSKQKGGESLTLLDIREDYEREICEIGGLHIPMGEIVDRINEVPKDCLIVVMCRSGKRAESVANLLISDLNYSNVVILEGGILAWIEQVDNQLETY